MERIRWGLLIGALLLVAVLAGLLSYGRYRAVKAYKQILARSGATITHETDGVTWTQAIGGKDIFTLHGKHVVPHGNGRYTLEDGMLLLYGANGKQADRIYGASFDYDEKQGVAQAKGEVDMDLEPPAGLKIQGAGSRGQGPEGGAGPEGRETETPQAIHVRTSGLTYVKKLGVAATDQEVEIEYGGMHGWARGAEFDSGQSIVHLLADVRAEATLHGAGNRGATPATLTARKADLNREQNVIQLAGPELQSAGRTASAAAAVLHLRKDGSLETVDASGGVTLRQGTRTIEAATLHAAMNQQSQMQRAELSGGVKLLDTNAERPMHGAAKTATVAFDGAGEPTSAVLEGDVFLATQSQRSSAPALNREMRGQRVTLTLVRARGGAKVSGVHAEGAAWARGDAVVNAAAGKPAGVKTMTVAADDLRLALTHDANGKQQPQSLTGSGHTRIEQRMPDGSVETSAGNSLEASFAQAAGRGLEIASAKQTGGVEIRNVPGKPGSEPSEAVAEQAVLDGATDVLTLTGGPRLTRGDTSLTAATVRIMEQSGDAYASGAVQATLVNGQAKQGALSPANKPGDEAKPVTHATAADAVLHRGAQTMEFHGTDEAPARMWQGASQVEAANLRLDRGRDSMQAWPASSQGRVHAVFAERQEAGSRKQEVGGGKQGAGSRKQEVGSAKDEGGSAKDEGGSKEQGAKAKMAGGGAVRVTSARMDYSGTAHQAVFTGGVVAEGEDGTARAERAVAFLESQSAKAGDGEGKGQPDPVAASVDRIVMSGAVKLEQPGRTATGEQMLYAAATGEFVLTGTPGHPPHVVDAQQGEITGSTLVFRSPDSTIVVAGGPASRRVHTETTMKK